MGTQAIVAVKLDGRRYESVTVNWDGGTLLPILTQYYSDPAVAKDLVMHGNISSLGERIHPVGEHSFDAPESGTTVFYHRDRGEEMKYNAYDNRKAMFEFIKEHMYCDYVYYFDGKKWQKAKSSLIK